MTRQATIFLTLVITLALACTGGDGAGTQGGGGTTAEIGEAAAQMLTVDQGGAVQLESGAAAVQIPAGALSASTVVTVEAIDPSAMPGLDRMASSAFDFGPDGTEFDEPVMLTLEIDQAAVPSNAELAISWLKDGANWVELPGSSVTGNMISAPTTHFSVYAVTFTVTDGGHIEQTSGMCNASDFAACGGNATGVWMVNAGCLSADLGSPDGGQCAGLTISTDIDFDGTVTISADGSYHVDLDATISSMVTYPKSCLPGIDDCSMIEAGASDTGDACVIEDSQTDNSVESGTWVSQGNSLQLTDTDGEASDLEYCVQGNRMLIRTQDEADDVDMIMVLTK